MEIFLLLSLGFSAILAVVVLWWVNGRIKSLLLRIPYSEDKEIQSRARKLNFSVTVAVASVLICNMVVIHVVRIWMFKQ